MSELVACKYSGEFCVILALLHYLTQSCPTLCDPTDCSPPGFSVHGIFQARILEWVAVFFSRGSSQPRDRTQVSCIAGKHFNALSHQGSPLLVHSNSLLFWKMEGVLHNSTYWIFCAPFDKFFSFLTLACILFLSRSVWLDHSVIRVWLCHPMDCDPPGSSVHGIFQFKNTGVGCHFLLQGIFPTQRLNPRLPHCRQILYHLSHWKVVTEPWKTPGFLASRGEEFNSGPETRLDRSELLCNKVILKYKV